MNQPPKKQKQKRSGLKKINVSAKAQWKKILSEVDKDEIPFHLLLKLTVNLVDGTRINIDIQELLRNGINPEDLEDILDTKLKALDMFIADIDFYVNLDDLVKTVQPITDKMLKDL
jgi:hypothetical protein